MHILFGRSAVIAVEDRCPDCPASPSVQSWSVSSPYTAEMLLLLLLHLNDDDVEADNCSIRLCRIYTVN